MSRYTHQPNRIEEAINKAQSGWFLCFVGEDQSKMLAALTHDLRGRISTDGEGKRISSGFSYWGTGPTIAWALACNDPFYLVMKESTESFPSRWAQVLTHLDNPDYHYVSLGIGTGDKDRYILRDLYKANSELFYFPVDMSLEMLRVGIQEAMKGAPIARQRILPIQINFSVARDVDACRDLLERIVGKKPILYSLLGNTIANFDRDSELLQTLSKLLRPQDQLLLEVAYTEDLSEEAVQNAAEEYSRSRAFREFVTSALLQNTDLCINIDNVSFTSLMELDRAIRINAVYYNKTGTPLRIMLPDRTSVDFPVMDTIRLYLTRKYTRKGINILLNDCGLSPVTVERSLFSSAQNRCSFGMELMLLKPSKTDPRTSWESAFISYGSPDQAFAEKLNKALNEEGIETFFFRLDSVPGDSAHSIMRKGVNEFDRTILICSKRSLERLAVRNEIDLVLARESREGGSRRLLPITIDDYVFDTWSPEDAHLKTALLDRYICDFTDGDADDVKFRCAFEQLLKALQSPKPALTV
jgi:uncharacterized SAM-dependent methyltransferase